MLLTTSHPSCLHERSPMQPHPIRVTAALIVERGRIFIAQRPPQKKYGSLWEFPGGKVEHGETLEESLQREIMEELCWNVAVKKLFRCVRQRLEDFDIHVYAYWCSILDGELHLKEHVDHYWSLPGELHRFAFTRPDQTIVSSLEILDELPGSI